MKDVLDIKKPQKALPLVFDSPHSGTLYPGDFNYACDFDALKTCEDHFVDDLFEAAPGHGGALLSALFPRSYIDPNRAEDDIDLQLMGGVWPYPVRATARADSGIGLVRRLVQPGMPIYDRILPPGEVKARIETYYRPYHAALQEMIDRAHYNFGCVYHINCHSMPERTAVPKTPLQMSGRHAKPVDFCIGTRDGTSASVEFIQGLRAFIEGLGYSVSINDPFKGVEITKRYGDPMRGRHSIQLEINKALYMDEQRSEKSKNYGALKDHVTQIIAFCAAFSQSKLNLQAAD